MDRVGCGWILDMMDDGSMNIITSIPASCPDDDLRPMIHYLIVDLISIPISCTNLIHTNILSDDLYISTTFLLVVNRPLPDAGRLIVVRFDHSVRCASNLSHTAVHFAIFVHCNTS